MFGAPSQASFDAAAHVIQLALTPIFLLLAVSGLLNVFSTRHARLSDRATHIVDKIREADAEALAVLSRQLAAVRWRSIALDIAVVLGAIAGAATCTVALVLFIGVLNRSDMTFVIFGLFGFALVCTIAALACFAFEMSLASRGVRAEVSRHE